MEKGGISENSDSKYFEKFGELFSESIKRIYTRNLSIKTVNPFGIDLLNEPRTIYLNEISQHLNHKSKLAKMFFGRAKLVEQVNNYLISDSNLPLIIHGSAGAGKSSLIAHILDKV